MHDEINPLQPGERAPDFTLPRSAYASVSLADLRGQRVVLVFYPADWEPVSQQQLTLYQEYLVEFTNNKAQVVAISGDHIWSHAAFAQAVGIRYPLLSDVHPRGEVARAYRVFDDGGDTCRRALFVIDEEGIIRWSRSFAAAINPGVGGILSALESISSHRSAVSPSEADIQTTT